MSWNDNTIYAPEFTSGTWLNSAPLNLHDLLDGGVALVDFWDYTCINCLRTLPYLIEWHERYADKGLTIVGVHTPEFSFARAEGNVEQAIDRLGIPYPVVLDRQQTLWYAYATRAWPTKHLVDPNRVIRYTHVGEGGYERTERAIQTLLHEVNADVELPAEMVQPMRPGDREGAACYPTTPELYAGWMHGRLGNTPDWQKHVTRDFQDPGLGNREDGKLYFDGKWRPEDEYTECVGDDGHVAVRYQAAEINAVLASNTHTPINVFVTQDGERPALEQAGDDLIVDSEFGTYVVVEQPRMYNLIVNPDLGPHEIALHPGSPGLALYAFSFVPCVKPTPMEPETDEFHETDTP